MSQKHEFYYRMIIVLLTVILVFTLVQSPRSTNAAPLAAGTPMVAVTVIDVPTYYLAEVSSDFAKIADIGTFTKHSTGSLVELTFSGRIYMTEYSVQSIGAIFELRVDGNVSSIGRARASLRTSETSFGGVPVSITGMFTELSEGDHTVSMWVRTVLGSGSAAFVNPMNFPTDVLIIKEQLPFGFAYMPLINK